MRFTTATLAPLALGLLACGGADAPESPDTTTPVTDNDPETGLPRFTYHPDPIGTGAFWPSDDPCAACGESRGHLYEGPFRGPNEVGGGVCPWCIADGSAYMRLGVTFADDTEFTNARLNGSDVSDAIITEVLERTPGFSALQEERWLVIGDDAGQFLGAVGKDELEEWGPDATRAIQDSTGLEGDEWASFLDALDAHDSPRGYLFRCRHTGRFAGYTDAD